MPYRVVFDVSERLPQLAVGVVATVVLLVVIAVGLRNADLVLARWPVVLGLGAGLLGLTWLVGNLWAYAIAVVVAAVVVVALELAGRPAEDDGSESYVPPPPRRQPPGLFGLMVGLFALVFAAGIGLPMIAAVDLQRKLLDGQATVVEGAVMIETGGKSECLVVDAERFCYSNTTSTPGWNRQRTILGGPFDTGDQVRLSVVGGQIVRIEVANTAT
jgi:hypothetical protein